MPVSSIQGFGMSALKREFAWGPNKSANIVQLKDETRPAQLSPSRIRDGNLIQAIDLVTTTADILDELMRQNDALEAEASKAIARFKNQAIAAQRESEILRTESQTRQQQQERRAIELEARVRQLEETLHKKDRELERRGEELDAAKQWIGHFQSRITQMFQDVSKEPEMYSIQRPADEAKPS
jgi:hypothetical protein